MKVQTVFTVIKKYLDDNFTPQQAAEITWVGAGGDREPGEAGGSSEGQDAAQTGWGRTISSTTTLTFSRAFLPLAALTTTLDISAAGSALVTTVAPSSMALMNMPSKTRSSRKQTHRNRRTRTRTTKPNLLTTTTMATGRSASVTRTSPARRTCPHRRSCCTSGIRTRFLGTLAWHHDVVNNTLPKIESVFIHEWWWTASCEYADIVFPVDSWAEFKHVDASASCTNLFPQHLPSHSAEADP
ncbi:MAG: hypothetical protein U0360_07480 [Dehalococcoidia bacterium]